MCILHCYLLCFVNTFYLIKGSIIPHNLQLKYFNLSVLYGLFKCYYIVSINIIQYFIGEKRLFMKEKKKKEMPCKCCIDCDESTNDYYPVFSNRGTIHRCVRCYELWLTRSTRYNIKSSIRPVTTDPHFDTSDPMGRNEWKK